MRLRRPRARMPAALFACESAFKIAGRQFFRDPPAFDRPHRSNPGRSPISAAARSGPRVRGLYDRGKFVKVRRRCRAGCRRHNDASLGRSIRMDTAGETVERSIGTGLSRRGRRRAASSIQSHCRRQRAFQADPVSTTRAYAFIDIGGRRNSGLAFSGPGLHHLSGGFR